MLCVCEVLSLYLVCGIGAGGDECIVCHYDTL